VWNLWLDECQSRREDLWANFLCSAKFSGSGIFYESRQNALDRLDHLQPNALPTRFSSLQSIRELNLILQKAICSRLGFGSLARGRGEHFTHKISSKEILVICSKTQYGFITTIITYSSFLSKIVVRQLKYLKSKVLSLSTAKKYESKFCSNIYLFKCAHIIALQRRTSPACA
jgi:hypothetical protein